MAVFPVIKTRGGSGPASLFENAKANRAVKVEHLQSPAIPTDYAHNLQTELMLDAIANVSKLVAGDSTFLNRVELIGGVSYAPSTFGALMTFRTSGITPMRVTYNAGNNRFDISRAKFCFGSIYIANTGDLNTGNGSTSGLLSNEKYLIMIRLIESRVTGDTDPSLNFSPSAGNDFALYNEYRVELDYIITRDPDDFAIIDGVRLDDGVNRVFHIPLAFFDTDGGGAPDSNTISYLLDPILTSVNSLNANATVQTTITGATQDGGGAITFSNVGGTMAWKLIGRTAIVDFNINFELGAGTPRPRIVGFNLPKVNALTFLTPSRFTFGQGYVNADSNDSDLPVSIILDADSETFSIRMIDADNDGVNEGFTEDTWIFRGQAIYQISEGLI